MKTVVLRKMGYSGTFIYVLRYEFRFQYLFAWNNEVYRQEVIIAPNWTSWRMWAWFLGIGEHPYSQYQLERAEQVVLSGAMKSIDLLKQDSSGSQRRKAEKLAKKGACQWQARADYEGKPIFLCFVHNKTAPLEDNPHHQ